MPRRAYALESRLMKNMSGAAPKMCSLPLVCHEVSFLPMIPMSRVVMHLHLPCKWSSHLGSSNAKSENSATGHIEFLDFINAAAFLLVRNPIQHARQRRFYTFSITHWIRGPFCQYPGNRPGTGVVFDPTTTNTHFLRFHKC